MNTAVFCFDNTTMLGDESARRCNDNEVEEAYQSLLLSCERHHASIVWVSTHACTHQFKSPSLMFLVLANSQQDTPNDKHAHTAFVLPSLYQDKEQIHDKFQALSMELQKISHIFYRERKFLRVAIEVVLKGVRTYFIVRIGCIPEKLVHNHTVRFVEQIICSPDRRFFMNNSMWIPPCKSEIPMDRYFQCCCLYIKYSFHNITVRSYNIIW